MESGKDGTEDETDDRTCYRDEKACEELGTEHGPPMTAAECQRATYRLGPRLFSSIRTGTASLADTRNQTIATIPDAKHDRKKNREHGEVNRHHDDDEDCGHYTPITTAT